MKRILLLTLFAVCAASGQTVRTNPGFARNSVPRNDDGSSEQVPLGFTLNFFGKQRESCWVNNNGNLTFDAPLSTFTPFGLQKTLREIIAPFFADVDTRNPASKLVTYGQDTVNGHKAFGANYIDVGYFSTHADKTNSFQVVLIERADTGLSNFDIEFNYNRITWETGDASGGVNGFGGVPAVVGWSNGTTLDYASFELPGSFVSGAFLDNGSRSLVHGHVNSTTAGRVIFRARDGLISPGLQITDGSPMPDATMGSAYSTTVNATGGTPPFRWAMTPDVASAPGLSLSPNGVMSGTPTTTGTYSFTLALTAKTEDGDQTVYKRGSITINSPVISITTACPLSNGATGVPYSAALRARGSSGSYTWSVDDLYALPPGVGLNATGTIAGTPLLPGVYSFVLNARSTANDGSAPASKPCKIVVAPAAVQLVNGCAMPSATVGIPYDQQLTPGGGVGQYLFGLEGQMPAGLSFGADGRISGTPLVAADNPFTISITDGRNNIVRQACSLSVQPAAFNLASSCPLPPATTGVAYSTKLASAYTWSLGGGTLPAGLTLAPDGTVSGTPMSAGPAQFRLLASDSNGGQAGQACSLIVNRGPLSVSGCPLPAGSLNTAYTARVGGSGGSGPYTFSAAGSLPAGLSLARNGEIAGTLTAPGSYPFPVRVQDASGQSATQPCSIAVAAAPLQLTSECPLPQAALGQAYSAQFKAKGGTAPYHYDFFGYLPDGLAGDQNGILAGTPRALGAMAFLVQVSDARGGSDSQVCSVGVGLPSLPSVSISTLAGTMAPAASASMGVELSQPYSLPIQGQVKMSVEPDTGSLDAGANQVDPRLRFANGQTSAQFTIPAGATRVTMPLASTGTVASTVTVSLAGLRSSSADLPLHPTARVFRIAAAPPVATTSCYVRNATGIEVQVSGFSTTRELRRLEIVANSKTFQTDLQGIAADYYGSADTVRFGGSFTLKIPVDLGLSGTANTAGTVSMNLFNAIGGAGSRTISSCQ